MPQFDPSHAFPQIAWLILVFGLLYLVVRASLPRVEAVVTNRAKVIGDDIALADAARTNARGVLDGYEATLAKARDDAQRLGAEAKTATAAETAAKLKLVEAALGERTATAQASIAAAQAGALANLRGVAEEATAEIVERLTGRRPAPDEVAANVAAVAA
ncbi:MAG: hypothetical protein ACRYG4_08710 [Janthinobacterium lividum]